METLGDTKGIKEKSTLFSAISLPPSSGKKPDSIVVLFHGYGDTSENFLFLGAFLSEFLPDTLFVGLEGPIACKNIPLGKQWLRASKNNKLQLLKEIKNLTSLLNQYLDNLLKIYNISSKRMALLGFSQGARIALHVGLRRPRGAGIVAFSGSYLDDPDTVNLAHPPILIVHGIEDKKAPVLLAKESYKRLKALKMTVSLVLLPGVDHDIAPQGLMTAGEFLKDCFSSKK